MPLPHDRADMKPCTIINVTSPLDYITLELDQVLQHCARQVANNPSDAPGCAIVDCSSLVPSALVPALYSLWITRVSSPSIFSHSCVCEHIRKQMTEGDGKVVMSIFNDTGGVGKVGEALAAGTFMVVFKKIDLEKIRCVPINFSTQEKRAIREYVDQCQSAEPSENADK